MTENQIERCFEDGDVWRMQNVEDDKKNTADDRYYLLMITQIFIYFLCFSDFSDS